MNTKTKTAVIALVLVAAAGFGAYRWYVQNNETAKPATTPAQTETTPLDGAEAPVTLPTAG